MMYLQVNISMLSNGRKRISKIYFKFDTGLIGQCHIIANTNLK